MACACALPLTGESFLLLLCCQLPVSFVAHVVTGFVNKVVQFASTGLVNSGNDLSFLNLNFIVVGYVKLFLGGIQCTLIYPALIPFRSSFSHPFPYLLAAFVPLDSFTLSVL